MEENMREALETLRAQMHRLVDERIDDAVARMESGEIWGRSWNRSKAYQQNKSETAHCAASAFCFRTRDGWYPPVCPCGPLCALLEKETGRRPAGIVSPAFWAACARLRAALAGVIERLSARSILCEIKGGGRKRPPPSHKAPRCGAFSMVKQGEPCAPFFGCKVVGKAKKSGMASLCAVSYHKNRRFSHD